MEVKPVLVLKHPSSKLAGLLTEHKIKKLLEFLAALILEEVAVYN